MSNDGSIAQDKVQAALQLLERKKPAPWVRLYDSKSAGFGAGGNIIPPQPADYIVVTDRQASLLEVKSSEKYHSLAEATIRNVFQESQITGARLWLRAKKGSYCVFYSLVSKRFEVWDMAAIVKAYRAPPRQRKLTASPLVSCTEWNLSDILYNTLI